MVDSMPNYLSREDWPVLMAAIDQLDVKAAHPTEIKFLFELMYWCGLRVSEALKVTPRKMNLPARTIYLGKTKRAKRDVAGIPAECIPLCKAHLQWRQDHHIKDDIPIVNTTRVTIWRWLNKLGDMTQIPALTSTQEDTGEAVGTHIFRKSIGKDMLFGTHRTAPPLNIISAHLRHKSMSATEEYLKLNRQAAMDHWS